MQATPFQAGRIEHHTFPGIEIVTTADQADIIVARLMSNVAKHFDLDSQYYIWTHEPAWCAVDQNDFFDMASQRKIHVSTAFNGDVYISPLYYFPFKPLDLDVLKAMCAGKTKDCAFLATYRGKFDRYVGPVNVDLTEYRQRVAMHLYSQYGFCDIFGRSWPASVKIVEESRGSGWADKKIGIIGDYRFNLAFENTVARNYVTEKLWHAIQGACVPVVYARDNGIAELLRPTSYIDSSNFRTVDDLYQAMKSMTDKDRLGYVTSAYEDYTKILKSTKKAPISQAVVARFCERIHDMAG